MIFWFCTSSLFMLVSFNLYSNVHRAAIWVKTTSFCTFQPLSQCDGGMLKTLRKPGFFGQEWLFFIPTTVFECKRSETHFSGRFSLKTVEVKTYGCPKMMSVSVNIVCYSDVLDGLPAAVLLLGAHRAAPQALFLLLLRFTGRAKHRTGHCQRRRAFRGQSRPLVSHWESDYRSQFRPSKIRYWFLVHRPHGL